MSRWLGQWGLREAPFTKEIGDGLQRRLETDPIAALFEIHSARTQAAGRGGILIHPRP